MSRGTTVSISATNPALTLYQNGAAVAAYATADSGVDGLATFSTVSMTAAGSGYVFRASSGALNPANSNGFSIVHAAADSLVFVQQPTTTSAGAIMSPPVTVLVRDAYINPVSGTAVSITTTDSTLVYGTLTQNSDTNGIATFTPLSMTDVATGYSFDASAGSLLVTSEVFGISAAAANLAFIQQPVNAVAGAGLSSIIVVVRNEFNAPESGITVSLTSTDGTLINGTLSHDSDEDGLVTFSGLSITLAANNYILSATPLTYTAATVVSTPFNITSGAAYSLSFSAQPVNTQAGTIMAEVQVQVGDEHGNPVPSEPVSLTTTAQLNGTTTVSGDAGGIAKFSDLYITVTGAYQLAARAGAIGPTSSGGFDITPGAVVSVAVSGDASITSGIESDSYTAVSRDTYGNIVSDTYEWSKTNGTGTANLSVAKLTGVLSGTVTITATSGSVPSKAGGKIVTVNPGAPSSIAFVQQPSTATVNVAISPAVTIRIKDVGENLLPGVSVTISTVNGAAISGTLEQDSNASGIAAFDDLSIALAGSYSLSATTGLITGTSDAFVILPTLPNAPSGLTAVAVSPTSVNITWTDNSNNEAGFRIERFISGSWQEITTVSAETVSYPNTGLNQNTFYNYRVRAYNAAGNSGYSNEASATTPLAPPDAPSGFIAISFTANAIALEWVDESANETGFKIQRSPDGITYTLRFTKGADETAHTDTGLNEGTPYWYRIYAYNGGGNSDYAGPISVTTLLPLPSAPSGLTATAISASQINLSWSDNSSNESGFKLERSFTGVGDWSVVLTPSVNATSISNTSLASSTTYYYRIYAYNATGNSGYSNNASATTFEVAPAAPSNLTVSATAYNYVTLTWTDNANNELGFKLERKTGVGGSYGQVATPTAGSGVISYTDGTVAVNTAYYYRVRAYNVAGDSTYSSEVLASTPLPPTPTAPSGLITTTVTSSSIGLQWADNSDNESGFKVERKTPVTGTWTYIDAVSANVTSFNNSGLSSGVTYYYRVYAWNLGGNSGFSNEVYATTLIVPPVTPTNLITTTETSTAIAIQWQDNSNDEIKFYIERATDGISFSYLADVAANVISYTNSGLTYTTTYWYRVRAYNTAGYSGYSNVISGTTLGPPPPTAPTGLTASAQAIDRIQLNWTDKSTDETGFRVYRSLDGISYSNIFTTVANAVIHQDTPVSFSITYYYKVAAYHSDNGESAPATTTGISISLQPDVMIKNASESELLYFYNNIYESAPVSQVKSQSAMRNTVTSYHIRVQNDGNISTSFKISGNYGDKTWVVTYYNISAGEPGVNITADMTGGTGYVVSLNAGSYLTLRMEVSHYNEWPNSYFDATIRAASLSDPTKEDNSKARTEAIPAYYTLSGSVYYPGAKTGRIYLGLEYSGTGGGETGVGSSVVFTGTSPVSFTIRGAQYGGYQLAGRLDHTGSGIKNVGNPNGNNYVWVDGNVSGIELYIYDQPEQIPSVPEYITAFPGDGFVTAFYDTPEDANGLEIANSYTVYWDDNPGVSKGSNMGSRSFISYKDNVVFLSSLLNGYEYYFVVTAWVGGNESSESPVFGPVMVNPPTGDYTVSGAILYPGITPSGPLYVGVYSEEGVVTGTRIASPSFGSQSYSIPGVADGEYMLFALLDMNNNGQIDAGDYMETEKQGMITVNGTDLPSQNKTLPTGYGTADVSVEHRLDGSSHSYRLNISVRDSSKQIVDVALLSGTGITSVIDIGKRDREFRYGFDRGENRPLTSDNYALLATYSDSTTGVLNAPVTAVLDCFAQSISPSGVGGYVVPTFSWSAPENPPDNYSYYLTVGRQDGMEAWRYPRDSSMPSTQLSVAYNYDGMAEYPELEIGTSYRWTIRVIDSVMNQAILDSYYTPTYQVD